MRASVMREGRLVVDEVPSPEPGPGEVLVGTLACGICGSDLHALRHPEAFAGEASGGLAGSMDPRRDVVMGHEFCAEILEHGPRTQRHDPVGTRVCSMPVTRHFDRMETVGYSNAVPGGYGERMVLTESMLLPVPNGLSAETAALTEPMAVGLHAVEAAQLGPEDLPLVIGCGPVGLAVINALRRKDVRPVVAADYSRARRKLAETLGADVVIDPAERSPYESWAALAEVTRAGERVPANPLSGEPELRPGVFFECAGVPGVLDQMMAGARRGCRFVVVGVCMEPDRIRPMLAITKELSLKFVLAYTPEEFAATLHAIAQGELVVDPLITARVGMDGVADAFEALAQPDRHAKVLVEPWRP